MQFPKDIKQKFDDLSDALLITNRMKLQLRANGGNTILLIYPPHEEIYYLEKVYELYSKESIIDIAQEFTKYIEELSLPGIELLMKEYGPSKHQIFHSNSDANDLFKRIICTIKSSVDNNKIPILVRTGALYGTGISNHEIMDDKIVRELNLPLVIFYPATITNEQLMFLNCKSSPGYRAQVIN